MWYQNIRSALFSFLTIHASDGQTDGQTELRQQYRALHYMQSHGKNTKNVVHLTELQVRIRVRFKIVRIYAQGVPHIHGHKHLDDDATNKTFAASQEYVALQGLKGLNALLCCLLFQGRIFNPTNSLNHVEPSIELMMQR